MKMEEQLRSGACPRRELTGIAHEFRNGLATIHGYARLLDLTRARHRPTWKVIRQRQRHLAGRDQFLELRQTGAAYAGAGRPRSHCRTGRGDSAATHGREGEVIVQGCSQPIEGDEVLLRQAVSNSTKRARSLRSERKNTSIIDGKADREQGRSESASSTTGLIQPESRDRVFRPFFTTKQQAPTGSALYKRSCDL
jgi:signal transduction histidine kinase